MERQEKIVTVHMLQEGKHAPAGGLSGGADVKRDGESTNPWWLVLICRALTAETNSALPLPVQDQDRYARESTGKETS